MKLRILGNSIRLRVSKIELATLAESGSVSDAIIFGADSRLNYCLESSATAIPVAAFGAATITVSVPAESVRELAETDAVAIRGEQGLPDGTALKILVEKDFECLVPRPGEDPRDLFDNPARR